MDVFVSASIFVSLTKEFDLSYCLASLILSLNEQLILTVKSMEAVFWYSFLITLTVAENDRLMHVCVPVIITVIGFLISFGFNLGQVNIYVPLTPCGLYQTLH